MLAQLDIFDPNNWDLWLAEEAEHECRIYANNNASEWAVVDAIDYQWALAYRWHVNKLSPKTGGAKRYMRTRTGWHEGGAGLYLHVGIMRRTGILPPSDLHRLVDHLDGEELNCRRSNLQWATPLQNGRKKNPTK